METQVSVVGVTGTVGSRVPAKLAQKGIQVRGIARDPSRFAGPANVELMGEDPLALERAVGLNVIEAAQHANIEHLVLHTALQSDRGNIVVGIIANKRLLEHAAEASGIGYTILRPGWFLQN